MNREILFRAKRSDNGEWVEGSFVKLCNYDPLDYDESNQIVLSNGHTYEVNPDTVCQFTGITDKNGVKIWEGDKVKFEYINIARYCDEKDLPGGNYLGVIGLDKYNNTCIKVKIVSNGEFITFNICHSNGCEVVGNIYDNPELLEQENDAI